MSFSKSTNALPADPSAVHSPEVTFKGYSNTQANTYLESRGDYSPGLIGEVLKFHGDTGGAFKLVVDVGSGPGNSTRALATAFDEAVGVDPSVGMNDIALAQGGATKTGKPIRYVTGNAEQCDEIEGVGEGSVDMITAATAVHWFNMPDFWEAASRALKPGGTVALWTCVSLYAHPSHPNASKISAVLAHLEDDILDPHALPGNRLSRSGYQTLNMPWDLPYSNAAHVAFDKAASTRKDWNKDGACSQNEEFFNGTRELTLEKAQTMMGTASMITRWREAHPDLANTDKDCVTVTFKAIGELLGEPAIIKTGCWTALVLVKKNA